MDEIKFKGKVLCATKGAAREYGRVGCNFYKGCPHGCTYCYLKRGAPSKQLGGNVAELKKYFKDEQHAFELFRKEAIQHLDILRETGVFFSFTTDPMIPETRGLTLNATSLLRQMGVPVKILTKCADWYDDEECRNLLFELNFLCGGIDFGFTLTGRDDMEPKASSNLDRIRVMRYLHASGIKTWASIEPVIDWQSAERVIQMTIGCCDHYKLGLRSGVKKDYYNLAESGAAIERIVSMVEAYGKTIYLKESARRLMRQYLQPGTYEAFLFHTVDMDGKEIVTPYGLSTTAQLKTAQLVSENYAKAQ